MKEIKDWIRDFFARRISRREFVERAATGGLGFFTTASLLDNADHFSSKQSSQHSSQHSSHHSSHHSSEENTRSDPNQTNFDPYEEWLKNENIPVYRDLYISNLRSLDVKPWKRLGVSGAYIDLKGGEGLNDGYICEIQAGSNTA